MKKILVTGTYDQIIIVYTEYLKKNFMVYSTGRSAKDERHQLDISNKQSTRNALTRLQPDIILNLAAIADVDGCENEPKIAEKLNTDELKTQKLEEHLGIKPPSVETCLVEFRKILSP